MKHILAVDDNPANLALVRETLKDSYKVTVVTSGEQALSFLEKKECDLILLDVCMPGMDGLQTLSKINDMEINRPKVIFLTALADKDLVEDGKALGVETCIAKPFVPRDMIVAIEDVLGV